jgi:hypothetical protein
MSQLYDISYSDYEDGERWVLEGPDMDHLEFEQLWASISTKAAKKARKKYRTVWEYGFLLEMISLLKKEHGFNDIIPSHSKKFNFSGKDGHKELFKYVPEEYQKDIKKLKKELYE